jgi:hypothetical protein
MKKVVQLSNCANFRWLDERTHLNDPLAVECTTNRRKIRRFHGIQVEYTYIAFPKKKIIWGNEVNLITQHIFNSYVSYQIYIIFTDWYNFTALKICLFLKRYCFLFVYLFSLFSLLFSLLIIPHWTLCDLPKSAAKQSKNKSEGNQYVSLILTEPLFGMFCLCSGKVLERWRVTFTEARDKVAGSSEDGTVASVFSGNMLKAVTLQWNNLAVFNVVMMSDLIFMT